MVKPGEGLIRITPDFNEIGGRVLPCTLLGRAGIMRFTGNEVCYRTGFGGIYGRSHLNIRTDRILCLMPFSGRGVYNSIVGYAYATACERRIWIGVLAWSCYIAGGAGSGRGGRTAVAPAHLAGVHSRTEVSGDDVRLSHGDARYYPGAIDGHH